MRLAEIIRSGQQRLLRRSGLANTIAWQRRHWDKELAMEAASSWEVLGYRWGDPQQPDDRLGNYRHVLELLQGSLNPDACVLEIGSYGGKWTQYMLSARKVICVDLFDRSFDMLRRRFGERENLQFYKTKGDELRGIASASVDLIFSMDTLVRVPLGAIRRYLCETHRVLASGGGMILHLPCDALDMSRRKVFTRLSQAWIDRMASEAGFRDHTIDLKTLRHGALLLGRKDGSAG